MSKRRKVTSAPLVDDSFEQFEQLASQVATLQSMSDEERLTDEELERFFGLIELAQHAALESERAKAKAVRRTLTDAEIQAASIRAFVSTAGKAAGEICGATIGELVDRKKSQ